MMNLHFLKRQEVGTAPDTTVSLHGLQSDPSESKDAEQSEVSALSGLSVMEIEHLTAGYGTYEVLHDLSASIPRHQITAVIGPSGCGKSTLLKCLNRMLTEEKGAHCHGTVRLNGSDISQIPAEELRRRIGMVFQTPTPFPMSVFKNMTYAPVYYGGLSRKQLNELVVEKLQLTGLYDEVRDQLHQSALKLSGGQQQRLCIARALTVNPEILLLDEPCSALDVKSSRKIEQLLTDLRQQYTILIVTHNLAQAKRISDHVLFLHDGNLIEQGTVTEVFEHPKQELTREFLTGEW